MTEDDDISPEDVFGPPPPTTEPPVAIPEWKKKYPNLIPMQPGPRDPAIVAKAQKARQETLKEKKRRADKSRAELSVGFLEDVMDMWREHGKTILARAAFAHPEKVVKIIADLMPKQMEVTGTVVQDLEDDRLNDLIGALSERLGRGAQTALGAAQGRATSEVIDAEVVDISPVHEAKGIP